MMEVAKRHYMRCQRFALGNVKPTTIALSLVALGSYLITLMGVLPWQYRAETVRCMEDLGCFTIDEAYALRPFNVLPQHRMDIGTRFILYNSNGSLSEYCVNESVALVSHLDDRKGLVVVIHGWISSRHDIHLKPMIATMVRAKNSHMNIILVEWKSGAGQTYPQSVANTRVVGVELAKLLKLVQSKISLRRVHLIGSSLGAHIAGTCGSLLPGIGRITALDAAGPLFEHYPESIRLDQSDAIFVDAIHTDGDDFYRVVMVEGGLGIHHSIGHADFYPNGGHSQPHCTGAMQRAISELATGKLSIQPLHKMVACDHELSIDYFAESLTAADNYVAYACHDDQQGFVNGWCYSTSYMGYDAVKPANSTNYYLQMSNIHPFEGDHYIVNVTVQSAGLICLRLHLIGELGVADHVEQHGLRSDCSASPFQTAMLFSSQSIGAVDKLSVTWEDRAESHNQVLVHGLTQLTVINATITHYQTRYFLCKPVSLGFTKTVTVTLSDIPCNG